MSQDVLGIFVDWFRGETKRQVTIESVAWQGDTCEVRALLPDDYPGPSRVVTFTNMSRGVGEHFEKKIGQTVPLGFGAGDVLLLSDEP